jgi:hypothetical protein
VIFFATIGDCFSTVSVGDDDCFTNGLDGVGPLREAPNGTTTVSNLPIDCKILYNLNQLLTLLAKDIDSIEAAVDHGIKAHIIQFDGYFVWRRCRLLFDFQCDGRFCQILHI